MLGIASLILLSIYNMRGDKGRVLGILVVMLVFVQIGIGLKYRDCALD